MYSDVNAKANPITLHIVHNEDVKIVDTISNHILWIKEKECHCYINFKKEKIIPNTLVFLSEEEVFQCKKEEYETLEIIQICSNVFHPYKDIVSILFNSFLYNEEASAAKVKLNETQAKNIEKSFSILKKERISSQYNIKLFENQLNAILLQSVIARLQHKNKLPIQLNGLVKHHFKTSHAVEEYAKKISVSPKSLLLELKNLGFQKPSIIIKKRILLEAKKMLLFTDKSAKEICFEIGFDDPAYFSRFFKKNTGLTTQEFKNALK